MPVRFMGSTNQYKCSDTQSGPVAHLVERLTCTEEAAGSNPVGSTSIKKRPSVRTAFFICGPEASKKICLRQDSKTLTNIL